MLCIVVRWTFFFSEFNHVEVNYLNIGKICFLETPFMQHLPKQQPDLAQVNYRIVIIWGAHFGQYNNNLTNFMSEKRG
jgi:hypothetical protein